MNDIIIKLFKLIKKSEKINDFPVAAIIYKDNKILSCGYNKRNKTNYTTDHAEIVAIKKANKKIKNWNLQGYSMIVTLEPCHMCEHTIIESRLDKVYYIVPRNQNKKPYKSTVSKKIEIDEYLYDSYIKKINGFFVDKR